MIGDRMDTDIVAGIETGLDTVLVLSGCHFGARTVARTTPTVRSYILDGVGCVAP